MNKIKMNWKDIMNINNDEMKYLVFLLRSIVFCISSTILFSCNSDEKNTIYVFNSEQSRANYNIKYQERLMLWKDEYTTQYIETDYGRSHIIKCGNLKAPPLVLLHGFSGTSTMWREIVEGIDQNYCIYAIDIIADINFSEPSQKISTSEDFAKWLYQTVNNLGIEHCFVVGESYGGWQIMNCAYRYPDLFQKAIVINPMPGLTDFTFLGNVEFISVALNPSRKNIKSFLLKMVVNKNKVEDGFIDLVYTGFQSGRTGIPSDGYILSSENMAAITIPVLYLIGSDDVFAKPITRFNREKEINDSSQMILVEGSGHDMITDKPEYIFESINTFFE